MQTSGASLTRVSKNWFISKSENVIIFLTELVWRVFQNTGFSQKMLLECLPFFTFLYVWRTSYAFLQNSKFSKLQIYKFLDCRVIWRTSNAFFFKVLSFFLIKRCKLSNQTRFLKILCCLAHLGRVFKIQNFKSSNFINF